MCECCWVYLDIMYPLAYSNEYGLTILKPKTSVRKNVKDNLGLIIIVIVDKMYEYQPSFLQICANSPIA